MTDQTPTLDSLCETIRELLPKVTPGPWRAWREGNQHLDGVTRETLVGASRVEPLVRPWNKRGVHHYFEPDMECVARFKDDDADLIALAPTMATALLSLASERAKQEAGEADIDALCIAWDGCLGGQSMHWQRDDKGRWIKPPLDEESREWPRRREFDRRRMAAFIASAAWQAASKPAAVNVEKAAEEIAARVVDEVILPGWATLTRAKMCEGISTLLRKHLTEAPAIQIASPGTSSPGIPNPAPRSRP